MGELTNSPRSQLYPRVSRVFIVLAVITLLIGAAVLLLVTGGDEAPSETARDLTYLQGSAPRSAPGEAQLAASIADLVSAEVVAEGARTLVFTAEVAAPAPETLRRSALDFRWEVRGDDRSVWTLTISIDRDAQVALFSDGGYGSGTIDDTLPGQLTVEGTRVEVRLDVARVEDFPSTFEWNLATTLRAFRGEPDSPRVEDRFPDEGSVGF